MTLPSTKSNGAQRYEEFHRWLLAPALASAVKQWFFVGAASVLQEKLCLTVPKLCRANGEHHRLAAEEICQWFCPVSSWKMHRLCLMSQLAGHSHGLSPTWWFIPLSKWVITLVICGISGVSPLIMNHQVSPSHCPTDPGEVTTAASQWLRTPASRNRALPGALGDS